MSSRKAISCTSCSTCNAFPFQYVQSVAVKDHAKPILAGLASLPLLASVALAHGQGKPAAKAAAYAPVDKVIHAKCIGCHNGPGGRAGVNLASYETVTKGKWQGKPLVVAAKPGDSVLSNAVHGKGMEIMPPPHGGLSAAELKTIDGWIAAGAKK